MKLLSSKATTRQDSFERIVESNYAIAIATLGDWLKKSRAGYSTNKKQKFKTNPTLYARDFPAL